jgi:hypothetical protein
MHGLAGRVAGASALVAIWALGASGPARADILVRVDKASQQMSVIVDGQHRYTWAVSNAS